MAMSILLHKRKLENNQPLPDIHDPQWTLHILFQKRLHANTLITKTLVNMGEVHYSPISCQIHSIPDKERRHNLMIHCLHINLTISKNTTIESLPKISIHNLFIQKKHYSVCCSIYTIQHPSRAWSPSFSHRNTILVWWRHLTPLHE